MARGKNIAILICLIIIVIMSIYFFYKNIFYQTKITSVNKSKPNVDIYNINSVSFDNEGKIATRIHAPYMAYNSYTKYSTITAPVILVYEKDSSPWQITANRGEIINGNAIYKLLGNVKLHQGPSKKSLEMTITTSELTIYPNKKIAETYKPISFKQINKDKSSITIHATGARINQKSGEVKLFSKARGVYNEK